MKISLLLKAFSYIFWSIDDPNLLKLVFTNQEKSQFMKISRFMKNCSFTVYVHFSNSHLYIFKVLPCRPKNKSWIKTHLIRHSYRVVSSDFDFEMACRDLASNPGPYHFDLLDLREKDDGRRSGADEGLGSRLAKIRPFCEMHVRRDCATDKWLILQ